MNVVLKSKRFSVKLTALIMVVVSLFSMFSISGCSGEVESKYANEGNWAYWADAKSENALADCFFIAPTVYFAEDEQYNMSLENESAKIDFLGASNMEKGIYDELCVMYAPYYSQVALEVYEMDENLCEQYLEIAYQDVREAFIYYMENENDGSPIILAGFSQGADMCIRLLKEFFADEEYQNKLVACYAIGWGITSEEVEEYPHLNMAQCETDIGVIITLNTEAAGIETSLMVEESTLSINPLNWSTTSEYASADLNKGACFTDYSGEIVSEIENLTGAYISETRGTLIVDQTITPIDYPPILSIFEEGIYHIYDYMFFYRNLQENVQTRILKFVLGDGSNAYTGGDELADMAFDEIIGGALDAVVKAPE